jgi:hypothetical protein
MTILTPVLSIPSTKSRNREDNITIATLSTNDSAIRTIKVKSFFFGYIAHMNANPGTKKININPRTARREKRRAATISKESPDTCGYIREFILAGILHKEIHDGK